MSVRLPWRSCGHAAERSRTEDRLWLMQESRDSRPQVGSGEAAAKPSMPLRYRVYLSKSL